MTQGFEVFPQKEERIILKAPNDTQMKRRSCFQNKSFPKTSTSKSVLKKTTIKAEILNTYFDR